MKKERSNLQTCNDRWISLAQDELVETYGYDLHNLTQEEIDNVNTDGMTPLMIYEGRPFYNLLRKAKKLNDLKEYEDCHDVLNELSKTFNFWDQ